MINIIEKIKPLCKKIEPVGSRITCNPAPLDTDEDWLVFVPAEEFKLFEEILLHIHSFEFGGSEVHSGGCLLGDPNSFQSYTHGSINVIATASEEFFSKFMEATKEAKLLNLLVKSDRIALFQKILYGNVEVFPSPELSEAIKEMWTKEGWL